MNKKTKSAAASVHIYTAIGGILGFFAMLEVYNGNFVKAFLLLFVTMIIDSTDGMLARKFKVKEVLPQYDGATLDNVIDMLNFAWIPILILGVTNALPDNALLALPLIAAMYAYTQADMKTEDGYFLGFPTYWNIIAFYLYFLNPNDFISVLAILIPTLLSFIPTRYLYPSKNYYMWQLTWSLGIIWFILMFYILLEDSSNTTLILVSLYYPIYYMLMSFWVELKFRLKKQS